MYISISICTIMHAVCAECEVVHDHGVEVVVCVAGRVVVVVVLHA